MSFVLYIVAWSYQYQNNPSVGARTRWTRIMLSYYTWFTARSLRSSYAHVQLGRSLCLQSGRRWFRVLWRSSAPTVSSKVTFFCYFPRTLRSDHGYLFWLLDDTLSLISGLCGERSKLIALVIRGQSLT